MNTATQTRKYASKIQFRNAAKKAGVSINTESEYSSLRQNITYVYDIDNKQIGNYQKDSQVGFEMIGLELKHAQRLHAAGFELHIVEVPDWNGRTRTAYIYRLPLSK